MGIKEKISRKYICGLALLLFSVVAAADCKTLIVVGMEDERAIAAGDDTIVVVGTAKASVLRNKLASIKTDGISAVYSFGVAGGLDPTLKPGDLLLSSRVLSRHVSGDDSLPDQLWESDLQLLTAYTIKARSNPDIRFRKGVFLGTDLEARDNPETGNKGLRDKTGADIIDNETHIAAQFAAEHQLPFLSIRAVSDSVNHPLPPAALIALDADGSPNGSEILKSLIKDPSQIPDLVRTAIEYRKSLDSLKNFRQAAGFIAPENCSRNQPLDEFQ